MSEGTGVVASKMTVRLTTIACVLGLVGIFFSLLHLVWPTPLNFALFMIVGQGSFFAALAVYAVAVIRDLKRKNVL